MTNHSYKGLTQPLQTDTTKPRPAKRRVPGAITVATVTAAAAAAYNIINFASDIYGKYVLLVLFCYYL